MNKIKSKKVYFLKNLGFTLIELLVVVAIIGVLATIVLTAVNQGRNKGADGGVKSNLLSTRAQAEVFYNTRTDASNSYEGVCGTSLILTLGGAKTLYVTIAGAMKAGGITTYVNDGTGSGTTATCNDTIGGWAAEVPLKSSTNGSPKMWCVDSTGKSKQVLASSLGDSSDVACD